MSSLPLSDFCLAWTHEPIAFRLGIGRLCATLIRAIELMRKRIAIRGNTKVPYFPPHGEIIFSLLFQENLLGNRAGDKSLKENKSTCRREKE